MQLAMLNKLPVVLLNNIFTSYPANALKLKLAFSVWFWLFGAACCPYKSCTLFTVAFAASLTKTSIQVEPDVALIPVSMTIEM